MDTDLWDKYEIEWHIKSYKQLLSFCYDLGNITNIMDRGYGHSYRPCLSGELESCSELNWSDKRSDKQAHQV